MNVPIHITPTGFANVDWADTLEIRAFKVDLFSVDEVRFSFSLRNGDAVEVSEEEPGFRVLVDELERRFPTVKGWEDHVMQPPFKTNLTVLYRGF